MPTTTIEAPETSPSSSVSGSAVDLRTAAAIDWAARGLTDARTTVRLLARTVGDAQRRYGLDVYEHVDRDPAAGGSVELLKFAVLRQDPQLLTRREAKPGTRPRDAEERRAFDESARRADFCRWWMDRLETPIVETSRGMLDALKWGAVAADTVWDVVTEGPYRGKIVPMAVRPMEQRAWQFGVDGARRVRGLAVAAPGVAGWQYWGRDKFAVLAWGGRAGNPCGESIYERAVEAWNFRVQVPPEHFFFLKRHGSPVPYVTPSESMPPSRHDPATGLDVGASDDALRAAQGARSGNAVGLQPGAEIGLLEAKSEGGPFSTALGIYRREIVLAILLQTRATMEAESGSKADSETAKNLLDVMIDYIRRWLARMWEWDLLYKSLLFNEGREAADLDTPRFDLGSGGGEDLAVALTALGSVGYSLDRPQFPGIDARFGFEIREMDETPPEPEPPAPNTPPKGAETP